MKELVPTRGTVQSGDLFTHPLPKPLDGVQVQNAGGWRQDGEAPTVRQLPAPVGCGEQSTKTSDKPVPSSGTKDVAGSYIRGDSGCR